MLNQVDAHLENSQGKYILRKPKCQVVTDLDTEPHSGSESGSRPIETQSQSLSQGDNTLYYPLKKINNDDSRQGYKSFFRDVQEIVYKKKTEKKDVAKVLLKERIRGVWGSGLEIPSYPDTNASTWGDDAQDENSELKSRLNDPTLTPEARKSLLYDYELSKPGMCMSKSATLLGKETGSLYYVPAQCRKGWCEDCGGWNGHIHLNRTEGVVKRVNLRTYQLQQLVLTVAESDREIFLSSKMLNRLIQESKNLAQRFWGEPIYDKNGHIKKYKLSIPTVGYLHMFGDPLKDEKGHYIKDENGKLIHDGKFHPHVNLHFFRKGHHVLSLEKETLAAIKAYWQSCLKRLGCKNPHVNLYYNFKTKKGEKYKAIKYMAKSYGPLEFNATGQEVKDLLVLGMKSFKHIRFWGDMANSVYHDRMSLREEKEKAEKEVNEEMEFLGVGEVDLSNPNIERISRNLYRLKGSEFMGLKEKKNEWEKMQKIKEDKIRKAVNEAEFH